jgi:hypothetical protein
MTTPTILRKRGKAARRRMLALALTLSFSLLSCARWDGPAEAQEEQAPAKCNAPKVVQTALSIFREKYAGVQFLGLPILDDYYPEKLRLEGIRDRGLNEERTMRTCAAWYILPERLDGPAARLGAPPSGDRQFSVTYTIETSVDDDLIVTVYGLPRM